MRDESIIYVDRVPILTNRAKNLLKSLGLESIQALVDYVDANGFDEVLSHGAQTSDSINAAIFEYKCGTLEYSVLSDFPPGGLIVREEEPSAYLEEYGLLSNHSLTVMHSIGLYTIGQFVAVYKNYDLSSLSSLGGKSLAELRGLFDKVSGDVDFSNVTIEEKNELVAKRDFSDGCFSPLAEEEESEALFFFISKATCKKLSAIGVATACQLVDLVDRYDLLTIPNMAKSNIDEILRFLYERSINSIKPVDAYAKLEEAIAALNERNRIIYNKRFKGEVLESIGAEFGITRERVRQIEVMVTKALRPYAVALLKNELRDRRVIAISEVSAHFSGEEAGNIALMAIIESGVVEYLDFAALFVRNEDSSSVVRLRGVAEAVIKDRCDTLDCEYELRSALSNNGLEFIDKESFFRFLEKEGYHIYGNYVTKENQSEAQLCLHLIERYFKDGISITQVDSMACPDIDRLKILHQEEYGKPLNGGNRIIYAMLTRENQLLLTGRSRFILPSLFPVEPSVIEHIKNFIDAFPKNQIYYRELFDCLSDYLISSSLIDNFNALHGVLTYYLVGEYTYGRDYLIKDKATHVYQNTAMRIEALITEAGRPISKEEIDKSFSSFSYIMIIMPICGDHNIIKLDNKLYYLFSLMNIDDELADIGLSIQKAIDDNNGYINKQMLWKALQDGGYSDFLSSNHLNSPDSVYSIARYLFSDQYKFNAPHIATKDSFYNINSYVDLMRDFLEGDGSLIKYEELVQISDRLMIDPRVRENIVLKFLSDYVRISANEYMLASLFFECFDEVVRGDVVGTIHSLIASNGGYLSLIGFDRFELFPVFKYQWNCFLLESIISLSSEFSVFQVGGLDRRYMKAVVVEKGSFDSYLDMVKYIVDRDGYSSSLGISFRDFLEQRGLIVKVIPYEIRQSELAEFL